MALIAGSGVAAAVGLSRVYRRARSLTDVLAGEALAIAMYALAALAVSTRSGGRAVTRRLAAAAALLLGVASIVVAVLAATHTFPSGLAVLACLALALVAAFYR